MAEDTSDRTVPPADSAELNGEGEIGGEGWSGADIEDAYRKALEAMEEIPWEEVDSVEPALPGESDAADNRASSATATLTTGHVAESFAVAPVAAVQGGAPDGPRLAEGTRPASRDFDGDEMHVAPPQVMEAALFVGGGPLTAKKFCALLRGSFDTAFVERTIDELNDAYAAQGRPYEIRLGDGGYRLELRAEYDRLRHRVYGSGPREVRLSQEILEVLALVAYQQPISQKEIESHGKQNAGNLLRQLLRRDLVAFERGSGGRKDVRYHTTPRFLSVFGLGSLDELPQAEDLAKK